MAGLQDIQNLRRWGGVWGPLGTQNQGLSFSLCTLDPLELQVIGLQGAGVGRAPVVG